MATDPLVGTQGRDLIDYVRRLEQRVSELERGFNKPGGPIPNGSVISGKTSAGVDEPALFVEPGVFIVRPDGTLYYGSVQTMPFARPHFDELLQAIEFALKNNYPARGEYVGAI